MAPTDVALPRDPESGVPPAWLRQPVSVRVTFYRKELFRHWRCVEQQREHFSEKAICDVETAILRLMQRVDRLCEEDRGEAVLNRLLRTIDGITRLSTSTERAPRH